MEIIINKWIFKSHNGSRQFSNDLLSSNFSCSSIGDRTCFSSLSQSLSCICQAQCSRRYAKPTNFFAVPRVWEKLETELRNREARQSLIKQRIWDWAKKIGFHATMNRMADKPPPIFYPIANFLVFKPVRKFLGLEKCSACCFGAAPINRSTLQYFASLGIPLINTYGMSQLSGLHTTSYNLPFWFKFGATGPPIRQTQLKIISESNSSREGQICMRGRNQFQGYLENQAQTLKTIDNQGFVHSGDIGHMDQQGFVYITGRIKEIIITSGGQNVAPVPIEHKLKQLCPIISNVMLVGDSRKFIAALLTLKCRIDLMTGKASDQLQPQALNTLYEQKLLQRKVKEPKASEVMKNSKVLEYIDQKIKKLNELYVVSRAAQIRQWRLLPGDFSVGGGHLTPSMKLKRKVVSQIYSKQIQELYQRPKL